MTLTREAPTKAARSVCLLGGFRVSVRTRTIHQNEWRLTKAANILKLLALAPGHRLHREGVMDLLWHDSSKKAASNNLRQTLHVASRTLYPDPQIVSRYISLSGEQLLMCLQRQL